MVLQVIVVKEQKLDNSHAIDTLSDMMELFPPILTLIYKSDKNTMSVCEHRCVYIHTKSTNVINYKLTYIH